MRQRNRRESTPSAPDAASVDVPGAPARGDDVVVDFYWRPGCPFCMLLKRSVKRRKLPVEFHNIWDDPEASAKVRAAAGGNETVPTIGVGGHMLVNPPAGLVEELFEKVRSGEIAPRT